MRSRLSAIPSSVLSVTRQSPLKTRNLIKSYKKTAIVDVGFGSMQVSLFDKDALISTQNLMLGVLRIREMMGDMQVSTQMQTP